MSSSQYLDIPNIQKDLELVDESIRDYNSFIKQFPEDKALKFGLQSVKNRQVMLLDELKEAYNSQNNELFDIKLSKDETKNNLFEIPALVLGRILTTYQELITSIVYKQNTKNQASRGQIPFKIKQISTVNVVTTTTGSFRIIFKDNVNLLSYSDEKTDIIKALNIISKIIDSSDDLEKLKEIRGKLGVRVFSKYKEFIETISKSNLTISFNDIYDQGECKKRVIKGDFSNRIYQTLTNIEKCPITYKKYSGNLDTLGQRERKFKFYLENGEFISGKFIRNLSSTLSK